MAERKTGTVVFWRRLSPILAIYRLRPEAGSAFPDYKAGRYIALRREDCRLTEKVLGEDGRPHFVPKLDDSGNPKRGPVTHSYSIASSPDETERHGWLEFYIVLEKSEDQYPGRLTESLFRLDPERDNKVGYVNRIVGDFTLEKRASGFRNVVLVGSGTGLAPFVSMIKQLDFEASQGARASVRYTLLHTNRTRGELAFHEELSAIEASQRFDFAYVPSLSRPTPDDLEDVSIGNGRANNVLRHILEMPMKEEEHLEESAGVNERDARRAVLAQAVRPVLPRRLTRTHLQERMSPTGTVVILTCGNPSSMDDIKSIADASGIRFEKEDWKVVVRPRTPATSPPSS